MIDRLGLVSLTWRTGGSDALSRFTLPVEGREEALAAVAAQAGTEELIYLATCNRIEVAFVGDGVRSLAEYRPRLFEALAGRPALPGEAERTFRAWAGEGAAEHLFLVAAGLDSAQVGEREIRGQMKEALRVAQEASICGPLLQEIFEEALRVAQRVHRETEIGSGRTSLAEIALDHIRERTAGGPVALIGVSPMTTTCAEALAAEGRSVLVVNRTLGRAEELAGRVGGESQSLSSFLESPPRVVAVLSATAAPEAVFGRQPLERLVAASGAGLLVIDMAIPADVDGAAARQLGLDLVTMDDISRLAERNRERRQQEVAAAREQIDEALRELRRRVAERWVTPVIAGLSRRYRATALEGVERLLRRELGDANDEQREAVRRWAESLAKRFAHIPARGLRALAYASGREAVEAFLAASDDALARELQRVAAELPEIRIGESESP